MELLSFVYVNAEQWRVALLNKAARDGGLRSSQKSLVTQELPQWAQVAFKGIEESGPTARGQCQRWPFKDRWDSPVLIAEKGLQLAALDSHVLSASTVLRCRCVGVSRI